MTTPQPPVDALAAQASACAESLRLVSQTRRVQDACDVLEQCARALAAISAPDAYNRKLRAQLEQEWVGVQDLRRAFQSAHAAPAQDAQAVKIPTSEDEAALMVLLGTDWLKQHAPHRLKETP